MTSAIDPATVPLLPTKDTAIRLRHFDPTVYNLSESSALYSYVDALVGDAGVGTLKKQLLINRLNQALDTTHFTDLDSTFGNIFKIARVASEIYPYNPATDLLTTDQWAEVQVKDAWYRARITNFFTALGQGGTPDGMRLMVKAALGVDTEVYEMWRFQDHYGEIYGIADVETVMNKVPNPSMEYGVTGWTQYPSNISATVNLDSSNVGLVNGTKTLRFAMGYPGSNPTLAYTGGMIPVSANKTYTLSFSYYKPAATSDYPSFNVYFFFFDGNGNTYATPSANGPAVTMVSDVTTRVAQQFTIPNGVYFIQPAIAIGGVATKASSIYFDAFMMNAGNTANTYVDGDTSGYRWTGAPGSAASIKASPIDALSRSKVPSRNEVIFYVHKQSISTIEMIQAREMLRRLAPVDSVITIANSGYAVNVPVPLISAKADSTFFQTNSYITGRSGTQLTVDEEPNITKRWLQDDVEKLAPSSAFNQPQEASLYYLYSTDSAATIDSVVYQSEDQHLVRRTEKPYVSLAEAPTVWGPWITFDLADSPDNYPAGKNGGIRMRGVAYAVYERPPHAKYVYAYSSQDDYVAKMTVKINSVGGQVKGTQYRLPKNAPIVAQNTWTPDEAVANVAPVKASTVSSGWFLRPTS